jgi:alkylated DNA repair protein alkB homolog 8
LLKKFSKKEGEQAIIYELKNEPSDSSETFYEKHGNLDQLTINDYLPGEGIPPHVDSHSPFEDLFCSLSLHSGVVMTFVSPNNEAKHVYLKPRSLVLLAGDARYIWQHSISLRKLDRVEDNIIFRHRRLSLTYRKIRQGECKCPHVQFCDSQKTQLTNVSPLEEFNLKLTPSNQENADLSKENIESLTPTEIEKKHVYDVYEKIAPHFSHTRYKPWPKVAEYLNSLEPGSLNADVGCGNGKYLNVNEKIFTIGTDRSFNLISICREKKSDNQVFVADSLKLPLRSETFDSAISIAVVHHFSNVELRIKALLEIVRILKKGGTFLIYVWALEQDEKKFTQQDNFVPWHLQNTYESEKQVQTLGPEIVKEEKKNATVYHRYYHMFKQGELEALIKNLPNISIVESYYDHANWCCIVKKEY